MRDIDASNAAEYLRWTGRISPTENVSVVELAGGVSNIVLLVERGVTRDDAWGPRRFVLKQARPRLRVAQEWLCSVERNWREVEVLTACAEVLAESPAGEIAVQIPRVLFADREEYLFAMTAAPREHVVWKQRLLAGDADPRIAAACGQLLGRLHAATWGNANLHERLGDRRLFDALRIDPYYRAIAAVHPDLRPTIDELIASMVQHATCLVHADFSPKNLLVFDDVGANRLMLVDYETGHYGDPAFDLGFFLSHLVLKSVYHAPRNEPFLRLSDAFWQTYEPAMASVARDDYESLTVRGLQHLAACALARLDGKSPVEYLSDPRRRDRARSLCHELFRRQPKNWATARPLFS